ncbi:MAG: 4a-hydroxytetrahydrobiopterin dehydratase [Hydrogenibacillus sp.]|nr:4a-hydroxytetrahydrobiopterin dehydratase [Hydrogenibacillus sp.]
MRLSEAEIERALFDRPKWRRADDRWIVRRYMCRTFPEAVSFVRAVAEIAEAKQHHPLIQIDYKAVTLKLSSWQAGGLTALDFELAGRFDEAYEALRREEAAPLRTEATGEADGRRTAAGAVRAAEKAIDLNADVGEAGGEDAEREAAIIRLASSVNIACGVHAGDPDVMSRAVRAALTSGAAIGAHPGLPDRFGFGRRWIELAPDEIERLLIYQIGALQAIAQAEGARLAHVKPHGALYNRAAVDRTVAEAVVRGIARVDPTLRLYALADSALENAARAAGFSVVREGFADRAYTPEGRLVGRRDPQAVHEDPERVVRQAVALAEGRPFPAAGGTSIRLRVDSICLHGDTPRALAFAARVREALLSAGYAIRPPGATPSRNTERHPKQRRDAGEGEFR